MQGLGVLLCSLHLSQVLAHCNPQHKSKSGFLMLSRKINTKFTVSRQNSKVSSKKVLRWSFFLWKLNLKYCVELFFINFWFLEITTLFVPLCILSISTLITYTELPLVSSCPTLYLQLRRISALVLCRQSPLNSLKSLPFDPFFVRNRRHQKDISKLTDLYNRSVLIYVDNSFQDLFKITLTEQDFRNWHLANLNNGFRVAVTSS